MPPTISDQQNVVLWVIVSFAVCIPIFLFCAGLLGSIQRDKPTSIE